MAKKDLDKADEVRAFLTAFSNSLEKDGFRLDAVRFVRDEQTGGLETVLLTYTEKEGGEQ